MRPCDYAPLFPEFKKRTPRLFPPIKCNPPHMEEEDATQMPMTTKQFEREYLGKFMPSPNSIEEFYKNVRRGIARSYGIPPRHLVGGKNFETVIIDDE